MSRLLFLSSLAFIGHCVLANSGPILDTHIGKFEGKVLDFGADKQVDAFYGIPFARPPVGDRRFEKPTDAERSDKTRSAVEQKPACSQPQMEALNQLPANEDCLYLNVFKPKQEVKEGYPAFVFVHGGAFQVGSAQMHSMDAVAENFAAEGMVFIALQYRLGVLGFASTGPEAFAGNYGLWDLRRALLWVRKNAKALNIDPKRITVGGYSAGSAAVGMLTVSEHTRDLFAQAIQMSGSPFAEWATSNKVVSLTEKLAKHFECDSQSSVSVKRCLRKKSFKELFDGFINHAIDNEDINLGEFSPRIDADFFNSDLPELIESSPKKPTLATITENEGILFTCFGKTGIFDRNALNDEQFENFNRDAFEKFVEEKLATEKLFGNKAKEVQKKVIKFYLSKPNENDPLYYHKQYAKLFSDMLFVVPQLREMRYKNEAGWPIYMLKSVHWKALAWGLQRGAMFDETTHGQEYGTLFGLPGVYTQEDYTEEDKKHKRILLDAINNFVKNKTPKTKEEANFEAISQKHPLVYSEMSTKVELKSPLFGDELNFWNELSKHYDFDLIRGIQKKTLRSRTEL